MTIAIKRAKLKLSEIRSTYKITEFEIIRPRDTTIVYLIPFI